MSGQGRSWPFCRVLPPFARCLLLFPARCPVPWQPPIMLGLPTWPTAVPYCLCLTRPLPKSLWICQFWLRSWLNQVHSPRLILSHPPASNHHYPHLFDPAGSIPCLPPPLRLHNVYAGGWSKQDQGKKACVWGGVGRLMGGVNSSLAQFKIWPREELRGS